VMIPPIKAIPFFGSLAKTVSLDNGSLDTGNRQSRSFF
jgi:hypothetical protein